MQVKHKVIKKSKEIYNCQPFVWLQVHLLTSAHHRGNRKTLELCCLTYKCKYSGK